jgi:alkanesulfonate monooxygenase SsuD/methylene tetrahydromethanopterin reductase-like flavin-dependent oxidoreductase (luciferase family)
VLKGRFVIGVGIGWLAEEFAALGVPFERRGARFDDSH